MKEELPPHNRDAERAVLGAILLAPDMLHLLAGIVQPDDFYHGQHQAIFRAMLTLDGGGLDYLSVMDRLEQSGKLTDAGGYSYVVELPSFAPTAAHAEHYARIVKHLSQRRQLIQGAAQITQIAWDTTSEDDPIEQAYTVLMNIQHQSTADGATVRDIASGLYDQVEAWARDPLGWGEVRGLATGIPSLDFLIGGLQAGWLMLVAGRPGMGKSALCFEIARRVGKRRKQVLIFSLEMPASDVVARWASCISQVETRAVKRGICPVGVVGERAKYYATAEELGRYTKAVAELSELDNVMIVDDSGLSATEIRARAVKRAALVGGLDLVIVDHIGLMRGAAGRGENTATVEGRKSNALRALAKDLGCVVLAACQLNRGVEARAEKQPQLSDLRDTGEHEQNAHVVVGLYRGSYYADPKPVPGSIEDVKLDLIGLKNREGPSGTRSIQYDYRVHRFSEFVRREEP